MFLSQLLDSQVMQMGKSLGGISTGDISSMLDSLQNDTPAIMHVQPDPDNGAQNKNVLNIQGIINEGRIRSIQSVIEAKFGIGSARVFRLLCEHKHLLESEVAELAVMSDQDTKQKLLGLVTANYVRYTVCFFCCSSD
jgi:hypothetical protein